MLICGFLLLGFEWCFVCLLFCGFALVGLFSGFVYCYLATFLLFGLGFDFVALILDFRVLIICWIWWFCDFGFTIGIFAFDDTGVVCWL